MIESSRDNFEYNKNVNFITLSIYTKNNCFNCFLFKPILFLVRMDYGLWTESVITPIHSEKPIIMRAN